MKYIYVGGVLFFVGLMRKKVNTLKWIENELLSEDNLKYQKRVEEEWIT